MASDRLSAHRNPNKKGYQPFANRLTRDLAGTGIETRTLDNENPKRWPSISLLPPNQLWTPEGDSQARRTLFLQNLRRNNPGIFLPRTVVFTKVSTTTGYREGDTFFNLDPDDPSVAALRGQRSSILRGIHTAVGYLSTPGKPPRFDMTVLYAGPEIGGLATDEICAYLAGFLPLAVTFDPTNISFPDLQPRPINIPQ